MSPVSNGPRGGPVHRGNGANTTAASLLSERGGLLQIRWHGRGGQGVVTASRILTSAALEQGLFPQSLPDFGAERSGAPLTVHNRLSTDLFWDHSHITTPDVVVVMDPTLLGRVPVLAGMKEGGILVANTDLSVQALRRRLPGPYRLACVVNATAIALELMGRNLPNGPTLGALVRAVPVINLASVEVALTRQLEARISSKVVEANLTALRRGHQEATLDGEL